MQHYLNENSFVSINKKYVHRETVLANHTASDGIYSNQLKGADAGSKNMRKRDKSIYATMKIEYVAKVKTSFMITLALT